MGRIEGQVSDRAKLAKDVLCWITCAKRPLTISEAQHGLAVEPGDLELELEKISRVEDILLVCAGLVTVDEESGIIRLVHYTTEEYFARTQKYWFPDAEAHITVICITYQSFGVFEQSPCHSYIEFIKRLETYKLYNYAVQNWAHHAREAPVVRREVSTFLNSDAKVEASSQALMVVSRFSSPSKYSLRVPMNMTGLHLASFLGVDWAVKCLLRKGADPNAKDSYGRMPLSYAAENGHKKVVGDLLAINGVDVDCKSTKGGKVGGVRGKSALLYAAKNGHDAVLKQLLEKGADPEATDAQSRTALSYAAENGRLAVVTELLNMAGVDVNSEALWCSNQTPLAYAAESGHVAVVQKLLEHGAKLQCRNMHGWTPLILAANRGNVAVVKVLLATHGIVVDEKTRAGRTALSYAAGRGHDQVFEQLLKNGAEVDSKDSIGRTPLSHAAEKGQVQMVKALLATDAVEINSKATGNFPGGRTALLFAADKGHLAVVEQLLAMDGIEINSSDIYGGTALIYAAKHGHLAVVKELLAMDGINVNSKETRLRGRSALIFAANGGYLTIVKDLLAMDGIEFDLKDCYGRTALSYAAQKGDLATVRELLTMDGIRVNSIDTRERTPLSYAAERGHKEVVDELFAVDGISVTSRDCNQCTPIMYALKHGRSSVVTLLKTIDGVELPDIDNDSTGGMLMTFGSLI